jgi:hypothetical protein
MVKVLTFEATRDRFSRLCVASHLSAYDRGKAIANLYIGVREANREKDLRTMSQDNSGSNRKNDFKRFVNVHLSDNDKEAIKLAYTETPFADLWDWIAIMTESDYKFSFTYDARSKAQQVAMFCWRADDDNYGHALSARHPEVSAALFTLLYKHETICQHIWPIDEETTYPDWG